MIRPLIGRAALFAATAALLSCLGASGALAFSSNPPDARTGAPGESTCVSCHSSFALNSGSGSLTVIGPNGAYVPGRSYDLRIELDDPDAARWGFEFTVLGADDNESGSLAALDAATQVGGNGNRSYGKHTPAGTQEGVTGSVAWTMRWTAPAAGAGEATIYLVGNAANGNGGTTGDRIYATSVVWAEGAPTPAPLPGLAGVQLEQNAPNPFNPLTRIAFDLDAPRNVRLTIYSVDGRRVRTLADGFREAGRHEERWDGADDNGRAQPSGTYFYRLQAGPFERTRSMVLVR